MYSCEMPDQLQGSRTPEPRNRYRPKGVFGKGVGNSQNASEMRQTCVKNASEMRQNGSCFIGKRGTSKMRQKSVKNASKMRGTPLLENTFWTIPKKFLERPKSSSPGPRPNRARVIAESLARVIAAIRIASVRWRSYLPRKHRN